MKAVTDNEDLEDLEKRIKGVELLIVLMETLTISLDVTDVVAAPVAPFAKPMETWSVVVEGVVESVSGVYLLFFCHCQRTNVEDVLIFASSRSFCLSVEGLHRRMLVASPYCKFNKQLDE